MPVAGQVRRKRARKNVAVSEAWPSLKWKPRFQVLRLAGVDEDAAESYAGSDWTDLPPDVKGMLLASWHMGAVGATTRRHRRKYETTRRMPVRTNRSHRNGSTKGAYPFADKEKQYRGYTMEQLLFARRDAARAAKAMKGGDAMAEAWYLDDFHTISSEVRRRQEGRKRNPAPMWVQSEATFREMFGVTVKEWGRLFRNLKDWQKREFHRRVGKSLSAKAVAWVVEQAKHAPQKAAENPLGELRGPRHPYEPLVASPTRALIVGERRALKKRGIKSRLHFHKGQWYVFVQAKDHERAMSVSLSHSPEATPHQLRRRFYRRTRHPERAMRFRAAEERKLQLGILRNAGSKRLEKYYVAQVQTRKGRLWAAARSASQLPANVVTKVAVVRARSKFAAISEAWKHRARLGI